MDATTEQQRKRERVHARKQANHDKVLAQKKRYHKQHRAEIKESKRLYAAGHRPQINEHRRQYRKAKKCVREHHLLVPSRSLSVSETAKVLLTKARARLASQEVSSSSSGRFFFLLGTPYLFLFFIKCFYLFFHSLCQCDSLFTAGMGSVQEQQQARDRKANMERTRKQQRAYYQANKAKIREYQRQYQASHREQIRERRQLHSQTHHEQVHECER